MKKLILALLLALLTVCLSTGGLAQEDYDSYLEYGKAVAGLSEGQSKGQLEDVLASRLLMRSKKPIENLEDYGPTAIIAGPNNHYTVQFDSEEKALVCLEALSKDDNIIYAHQDGLMQAYDAEQFSEKAIPVEKADPYKSWGARAMGADDLAASISSSGSITVAVIDTGVASHSFINSRVKNEGADFTSTEYSNGRHDVNGHGTHVAGTIVDLTQDLKVYILPVRVLGDDGYGSNSGVANGIRYAADAGVKVINMSLGGEVFSPYYYETDIRDAVDYAVGKGVTIVVAAGNSSQDASIEEPANYDNVITVSAITSSYELASFSNYGDVIDVAAPGVNITSCSISGGFVDYSGTSMASPHVAAIAAMVKLAHPGYSPERVSNYISANCLDLGDEGWDKSFGYGMPCFITGDEGEEGDYAYRINEDGAIITAYTGTEAEITFPETLNGYSVVGIEEKALSGNEIITSVTIPGCYKEIGNYSFENCVNLASVTLENGVIKIGDSAFRNCANLVEAKLSNTLENIGPEAFAGCSALAGIELPYSLEAIGAGVFRESGLVSLTVPASVKRVPTDLLRDCAQLVSLEIESGVLEIGTRAVTGCENLKTVVLPESVTLLEPGAFMDASIESIEMPGVVTIGYYGFCGCSNLLSVVVNEGVTIIDDETFADCTSMTRITLPRSLEEIGMDAFAGCDNLTIYGYVGGPADEVAADLGLEFVSLGNRFPLTGLEVEYDEFFLDQGEYYVLEDMYSYEPEYATESELDWVSSDTQIVEIVERQYDYTSYLCMYGNAEGTCEITGTAKDESGLSITLTVTVGQVIPRGVRLDKTSATILEGETFKLTASVTPAGASQSVIWESSNPDVASVDENGLVTAVSTGTAEIAAICAEDEYLSAFCIVTVKTEAATATDFTIRPIDDKYAAISGYTGSATAVSIPASIEGYSIAMIDDEAFLKSDIVSVSIPEGVEIIGEKAFANSKKLKSVSLPESLKSLAMDAFKGCSKLPKVKSIDLRITDADEGFMIAPVFTPANTASGYSITASGKKMATISKQGLVLPQTEGYFTLTVKAGGKKTTLGVQDGEPYAAAEVKIKGKAKRNLNMKKTLTLSYTIKPATAQVVATWRSENQEIATVDGDGTVIPVAPGKVKIYLDTDIGLSDFVTITVK
ncbi:MAG: leucine-rich repeat protein [Clostridia bacterium]|nr:leucine-rich repeat protein [Clostridia bacterium]